MKKSITLSKKSKSSIAGKRCLVVGGGGSIGSELVRQLVSHNKVFVLDNDETACFDLIEELKLKGYWIHGRVGDIRERETVRDVFSDFKPQIIFHAAAYKHVTPMEWTPIEAINVNVLGTYNLLDTAKRWECVEKFVYISTDKAIHSNSVMGTTKKLGEIMTRNSGKGYVVVRFGNVLGSRGSVIPLWQRQLEHGEPLTVTHRNMKRYFMSIEQACELVIKAAEEGIGGETIIFDMKEPKNVLEIAKRIIAESGEKVGIRFIGVRPGEMMEERLMTAEEEKVAVRRGNFLVIP